MVGISRPARGSTARAACSSVNGGGKVDHMGGSIVGLRLSTFRGNVRLSVQQKCHLSNPGSYQMSTAPVVRFAAAVYSDPENGPESAPLCPLWPICASPWTVCLSLFGRRRYSGPRGQLDRRLAAPGPPCRCSRTARPIMDGLSSSGRGNLGRNAANRVKPAKNRRIST